MSFAARPVEAQDSQHHALEILAIDFRAQCLDILEDGRDDLLSWRPQRHTEAIIGLQHLADVEQRIDRAGAQARCFGSARLGMLEKGAASRQPGADRRVGLVERLGAARRGLQDDQRGKRDGCRNVQGLNATSPMPEKNSSAEIARRKP